MLLREDPHQPWHTVVNAATPEEAVIQYVRQNYPMVTRIVHIEIGEVFVPFTWSLDFKNPDETVENVNIIVRRVA